MIKAEFFKRDYFGGAVHYARVEGAFYFWDEESEKWLRSHSQLKSYDLYKREVENDRITFGEIKGRIYS